VVLVGEATDDLVAAVPFAPVSTGVRGFAASAEERSFGGAAVAVAERLLATLGGRLEAAAVPVDVREVDAAEGVEARVESRRLSVDEVVLLVGVDAAGTPGLSVDLPNVEVGARGVAFTAVRGVALTVVRGVTLELVAAVTLVARLVRELLGVRADGVVGPVVLPALATLDEVVAGVFFASSVVVPERTLDVVDGGFAPGFVVLSIGVVPSTDVLD